MNMIERIKKALATEGLELLPKGVPLNVGSDGEMSVYLREIQQPTIGRLVYGKYVNGGFVNAPETNAIEWGGNRGAEIAIKRALKEIDECASFPEMSFPEMRIRVLAIAPTQEKQT